MEISVLLYIQYDINAALNPPKHKSTGRCNNLSHLNISLSRSGIRRIGDFSIRSPPLGELTSLDLRQRFLAELRSADQ